MATFTVRVHPRSSRNRLRWDGETAEVWVTSPPVKGAANRAAIDVIARWLGVPPSAVTLVGGQRSRTKVVQVAYTTRVQPPAAEFDSKP